MEKLKYFLFNVDSTKILLTQNKLSQIQPSIIKYKQYVCRDSISNSYRLAINQIFILKKSNKISKRTIPINSMKIFSDILLANICMTGNFGKNYRVSHIYFNRIWYWKGQLFFWIEAYWLMNKLLCPSAKLIPNNWKYQLI